MKPIRSIILPVGPSIAYVPLTQGQFALIDAADAERVGRHNWCAAWEGRTRSYYAVRNITRPGGTPGLLPLHRFILEIEPGLVHDHINRVTLDNRSCNLRPATPAQNQHNQRMRRTNITGFKGVSVSGMKYRASITVNRKQINLGTHDTREQAHAVVCQARAIYHGEFGRIA